MKKNGILSNISWNMVGMILYNIALWFLSFITLRVLGATQSGYYGVAITIGASFYAISLWGLRSFIVSNSNNNFTYEDYIYTRIITIVFSFLLLLVYLFFLKLSFNEYLIVLIYSMFKFLEAFIEVLDCICQKNLVMSINSISMLLRAILLSVCFVLVSLITKNLICGLFCMFILTLLIAYFYNYRVVSKMFKFKFKFNLKNIKSILFITFPIMCFEFLSSLTVLIPRLKYKTVGNIEDFGIYVSIYTLIVFLQLVIQIFIVTFSPYMANDYNSKNTKEFFKKVLILICISIILGLIGEICVYFIGEFVIGIIYGKDISGYYTYMYWAIISGVTLGITWIFSQLFVIFNKNYKQLFSSVLSVILCFIFSNILIYNSDVNNISKVLVLTNLVFIVVSIVILWFDYKKEVAND